MKYTKKELGFILYNNRSVKMVKKFIKNDDVNPFILTNIEKKFDISKNKFNSENKMIKVSIDELNIKEDDIIITKEEVSSLTNIILENNNKFNEIESEFLNNRKIPQRIIEKWNLLGLSNLKGDELRIIGATVHPVLSGVLNDGVENGGILFPLFENGKLVNCSIRKINSDKSLKYGLSCPDVPVWFNYENEEEIWVTEGLFDLFSLDDEGLNVASCSSGIWSGLQLYKLLKNRPNKINIFSDNDEVGIRTSFTLKDFFESMNIECNIFRSDRAKDPCEHFYEKGGTMDDLIEVTDYVEESYDDDSFDFLRYMKNRKF